MCTYFCIILTFTGVHASVNAKFRDAIGSFLVSPNTWDYDIIYPRVYDSTYRRRRDINSNVYYEEERKLKVVELRNWVVELNTYHNLTPVSNLEVEWISDTTQKKTCPQCDFTTGFVRSLENCSLAVLTICGAEIRGFIYDGLDLYFLEPTNSTSNSHFLLRNYGVQRRKRSEQEVEKQWEFFNLTGDVIDIETDAETNDAEDIVGNDMDYDVLSDTNMTSILWRKEETFPDDIGYFVDTAWESNVINRKKIKPSVSTSPPQWLEIALAVDYTVIGFHGRERVQQYILSLMNIVNAIYQDPSLDANLQLVITRMFFYETKKQSVVRVGNAKKSLENANAWNRRLHLSLAPGEPKHDIAVWLTRSDIGGPSGYAPVGGTCDPKRSCTLNRDEGLTSAFIIAHEIAHIQLRDEASMVNFFFNKMDVLPILSCQFYNTVRNILKEHFPNKWIGCKLASSFTEFESIGLFFLGLSHDGEQKSSNTCGGDAFHGSIMAPMVSSTFHKFIWSDCSRREFHKKTSKFTCLLNKPAGLGEVMLNASIQSTFSMDEQCRMEFGEGYSLCRAFDIIETCSHLWCGHVKSPLVCKTKKGPPLEGTECGFDKWCINGYCERVDKRRFGMEPVLHNPQDGGWGSWSEWQSCSRSCDTGVQFRSRKCDNPEPMYGGNNCFGLAEEWKICTLDPCPEPIQDIRAQQCLNLPKYVTFGNSIKANMTWLPYESEDYGMKCKLICTSKETRELYITDENLIDGTPCSYESNEDICIQGTCQPLGCDGKLFSNVRRDSCGTCGGNSSDCANVKSVYRKRLKREVSRLAVIPRLARQIKIEANFSMSDLIDPTVAFILKDRKKRSYTITVPNVGTHNEIIEGTKFYYKKFLHEHNIWANGPVLAEMIILVYASRSDIDNGVKISFRSQYFIHKNLFNGSARYTWIIGGWGPCSQSCGGGRRQKTVACFDKQNSKIVLRKYCSLFLKPAVQYEKCNIYSCNFHWIVGEWEPCSTTCGSHGIQSRELYCVPQSVINGTIRYANGTTIDQPWRYMVSPSKCGGLLPTSNRPCSRIPCPSYWIHEEWSQCSSSCGPGTSIRESYCPPPTGELFYTCGPSPPVQRKVCRAPFRRQNNLLCKKRRKHCTGDKSKYCSFSVLSKYCKLRGFRSMCCKSCSTNELLQISE